MLGQRTPHSSKLQHMSALRQARGPSLRAGEHGDGQTWKGEVAVGEGEDEEQITQSCVFLVNDLLETFDGSAELTR